MNNFFINITKDLEELKKDSKGKLNNLEDIVKAFESHPSIEKIKKAINTTEKFSFRNVKDDEVRKFIMNLGGSKATPVRDIPTDMLKQTMDIHLPIMTQIINMSIDNNCDPDDLKLAEVSPVFEKKDDLEKKIIDLPVFYLMCQRSSKELCTNKLKISRNTNCQNL